MNIKTLFISGGWNVGFMDVNVPAAEELQKRVHEPERLLFCEGNTRQRVEMTYFLVRTYRASAPEDIIW